MYYFIINPKSGKSKAEFIWQNIEKLLSKDSIQFSYALTEYAGHASELADSAVRAGETKIICIGGDGTLNEIVNGMIKAKGENLNGLTIGLLPTGTGNDWGRIHKIPNKTEEAFDIIKSGKTAVQDIGKIIFDNNENKPRYFVNVAGTGFDALVARNVNVDKMKGKTGIILFAKNLLTTLFKSENIDCTYIIDGVSHHDKIFSIAVGIGKYNGGGMMQLPAAVHDDGLLDVTVIGNISKFDVLRYVPLLFNGKFIKHPKVHTYTCKEIAIESENQLLVETEGEVAGTLPVKIEIIPKALRVFSGIS